MQFDPTKDQTHAIEWLCKWIQRCFKQSAVLAGSAGTGKTTLVRPMIDKSGLRPYEYAIVTYTAQATRMLRKKGIAASTIHRLMYKPETDTNGKVHWIKLEKLSPFLRLIVVDEGSMVGKKIRQDLESYGIPVLYIGDHKQLGPVGDNDLGIMQRADVRLEEIHRQVKDSPIIKLAMDASAGKGIAFKDYGYGVRKVKLHEFSTQEMLNVDQMICGRNTTRVQLNARMRSARGFSGYLPKPTDKIICLKNDYELGLVNGMLGEVIDFDDTRGIMSFRADTGEEIYNLLPWDDSWMTATVDLSKMQTGFSAFDYGNACTVHKTQGSQFENVGVIAESLFDEETTRRLHYTAFTRAESGLTIAARS